jgi:hypothetical protein
MTERLPPPRLLPYGEAAVSVEFGDRIDPTLNGWVIALDRALSDAGLPGLIRRTGSRLDRRGAASTLISRSVAALPCRPKWGSLSVHRCSAIGGRPLSAGDRLACAGSGEGPLLRLAARSEPAQDLIRVMLGPQDDHFTANAVHTLLEAEFRISSQTDRMGCRLDGPILELKGGLQHYNIVSDGIVAGHIQVSGEGRSYSYATARRGAAIRRSRRSLPPTSPVRPAPTRLNPALPGSRPRGSRRCPTRDAAPDRAAHQTTRSRLQPAHDREAPRHKPK